MLLRHLGFEVGIDHLIGMGRDGDATGKPCRAGPNLIQREGSGLCRRHGQAAILPGVTSSSCFTILSHLRECQLVACVKALPSVLRSA